MKSITSEVIAEVRGRANILEVVADTVALKRAGKHYKGLCPFHNEKTPSFTVNPERGIFKCFGCGEGGDVFAFVQKAQRVDFIDSVKNLAERYGVQLVETQEQRQEHDRRSLMLMLYQQASEFYMRMLQDEKQGAIAREYLKRRGITEEIIQEFRIGYAPNTWDSLIQYLTNANKVSPSTLAEAGLVRHKEDTNSYYDLFRHRLMVPIADDQGRVIAFGGRTFVEGEVKYINSPESPIYTKGQHLYGLNVAKDAIRQKDSVIVVEGYFDAIALHQFGFKNSVATLGTALTERQAKLLVRHTESKRVYLSFDADAAGQKAAERGIETLNQVAEGIGIQLRVIRVPGGKDPDECLRAPAPDGGAEAFEAAIQSAPLLTDYQLERAVAECNLLTHTGRIEASKLLVPILSAIKNSVARGEYIRQWAVRLNIREEELLSDVSQYRRQSGIARAQMPSRQVLPRHKALPSGCFEAERQLLALYMTGEDDQRRVASILANDSLIDPVNQRVKEAIEKVMNVTQDIDDLQSKLMDELVTDQDALKTVVDLILKADELKEQNFAVDVILKDGRARILKEKVTQEKNRLRGLLNSSTSDDEQKQIQSKIGGLMEVEAILLPKAQTDSDLSEIKVKVDRLLGKETQVLQVESNL